MRAFESYHPLVLLIYFSSIIGITMFVSNIVILGIALFGSFVFCMFFQKQKTFLKGFAFALLTIIVVSAFNSLFSHNGKTQLFFMGGNAITLEAIIYGLQIGALLVGVLYWFACFNEVMSEDKLLYLFGRAAPKLSVLLSSALRFIPLFKNQYKKIKQAQTAIGLYSSEGYAERLHGSVRVFNCLVSWSLENAVSTGLSMKARGYGLRGRSRFSLFRFTKRDFAFLLIILILWSAILPALVMDGVSFSFYPTIEPPQMSLSLIACYISFGTLAFLPIIIEGKEYIVWKYYRSKI